MPIKERSIPALVLAGALSLAAGPGGATEGGDADAESVTELTYEGLKLIEDGPTSRVWERPGIDLSDFKRVHLLGAGVQFRPGGETGSSREARRRGGPFEVTEAQKARFIEIMGEAFEAELAQSELFELTEDVGPDVLLIEGALLDVVSWTPPNPTGNQNQGIQLVAVGEATLVLEARDSITNTVFARAVDRRAARRPGGRMFESNRVNNENQLRRLASSWASLLRTRLEEMMGPQ
jgi:hypothetical protein